MKVKALWGFIGNADLLGGDSPKVVRGQEFDIADEEYAHALVGKELVVELDSSGKPKNAKPKEGKPAAPNEGKAATDKAAADKAAADKAAEDKAAKEAK